MRERPSRNGRNAPNQNAGWGIATLDRRFYIIVNFGNKDLGKANPAQIPKEILTVPQMAEYLCVSESIIRRLIRDHKIPFNRIEGRIVFFLPAIREWLMNNVSYPDGRSDT